MSNISNNPDQHGLEQSDVLEAEHDTYLDRQEEFADQVFADHEELQVEDEPQFSGGGPMHDSESDGDHDSGELGDHRHMTAPEFDDDLDAQEDTYGDPQFSADPQVETAYQPQNLGGATDWDNDDPALVNARPIPRISIQAFCEVQQTADAVHVAAKDRRLSKAHVSIQMGGIEAAIANYQEAPTPNLIIIESTFEGERMLGQLDQLAEYCDAGTKVIILGHSNDVSLYRGLLKRGVSEYVIAPVRPLQIMESISNLYTDPDSEPVGNTYVFAGTKGGVGSSTICHNTAWVMSEFLKSDVVICDLDLPFGTAGLDFNQDPVQGIADALSSPDRLDEVLLDRLLSKCTDKLSLFAAPATLERDYDIPAESFSWVIDVVRQNVPYVAVDLPHLWSPWAREQLMQADEVVITATPDLASLRNAKNMLDLLREHRSNDRAPHLVINQVGVPKRPEIPVEDFAGSLGLEPKIVLDFDAETFGLATNNGQMIGEVSEKAKSIDSFHQLAMILTHRTQQKVESKSKLGPLLSKFGFKK